MAVWRLVSRSYHKYASNQITRNYSQILLASSLTHAVKETNICSLGIPHSDICRKSSTVFENGWNARFFATSQTRLKEEEVETDGPRLNENITAPQVRVVTEEGHFIMSRNEALRRAKDLKLDLVEVQRDAKPPVCKIMDYKFEKYKKSTVEKERAKAKRSEITLRPDIKEIQFTPKIEAKDLKFKADQALKMMERGYRVKCAAVPEKKQSDPEQLLELLSRFTPFIEDAVVENGPRMEKKSAFVVVRHAKFGQPKKGGTKKVKDIDIKTAARSRAAKEESSKPDSTEKEIQWSVSDSGGDDDQVFGSVEVLEKAGPGLSTNQGQPVQVQNRYARKEPSSEFSAGRDANRSPNQPLNPQRPRFPNQPPNQQSTGRFEPQSPNQPLSQQRPPFPNQPLSQQRPPFPGQAPNQQPAGRFEPGSPNQPLGPQRPPFPGQAPNQQPAGRVEPRFPDRQLDQQRSPPQFQNQAANQQPTRQSQAQSPNHPRAPERLQAQLPKETPDEQSTKAGRPSGPVSSYGIFSDPKTK